MLDENFDNDSKNIEQYLSFKLAEQHYGVDILRVKEIRGWSNVTPIPNSPHYVKGVMNLRGEIVPIIDMCSRFSLESKAYGPLTVVIILEIEFEGRSKTMGLVVDAVAEVFNLEGETISLANEYVDNPNKTYINGLISKKDKTIVLLDVNKLLDLDEYSYKSINNAKSYS